MDLSRILTKDAEGGGFGCKTLDFPLQIETKDVSAAGEFEGYASVWNVVDQGGDSVQPGAFIDGLKRAKDERRLIPMLWQHDRREPIGIWTDMAEDTKGLYVKGKLLIDVDPLAKRAHGLLQAGALGGMSIGYRIPMGGAEEDTKRRGVWLLKKIDLIEVSLVTLPMLTQAKVTAVKNILESGLVPTVREFEGFLRDAGFSNAKAAAMATACKSQLRGEPDDAPLQLSALERFEQSFKAAREGAPN